MSDVPDPTHLRARKCWRTLEPVHGMIYFVPEAAESYAAIGLEGRSGYFASRAAPMGAVTATVVQATFFNFHPALVERAMDGVWDTATPAQVTDARLHAADAALGRLLGEDVHGDDVARATDLLRPAVDAAIARPEGRPLFAGHAQLADPEAPHLRLWWSITLLREFRGDGHIAAIVDAGLGGLDALILHAASGDVPAAVLRDTRAWSEAEWTGGVARLADRGLVDDEGGLTPAGRALRQHVEDRTDALAAPAWEAIGEREAKEIRDLVRPHSKTISSTAFNL